jgi:hypothetical protein
VRGLVRDDFLKDKTDNETRSILASPFSYIMNSYRQSTGIHGKTRFTRCTSLSNIYSEYSARRSPSLGLYSRPVDYSTPIFFAPVALIAQINNVA